MTICERLAGSLPDVKSKCYAKGEEGTVLLLGVEDQTTKVRFLICKMRDGGVRIKHIQLETQQKTFFLFNSMNIYCSYIVIKLVIIL